MKITRRQLRNILEGYNSMSDAGRSLAARAKRKFHKDYPEVRVGINAMEGWIEVEGRKAVNMSSASGRPMTLEDIVDKMKQAYLGHPVRESITKHQLRRIIRESIDQHFRDSIQDDVDYYEQRIQDEREELYLDDLNILKRKIEQYGAIDMQRLMGDIKKTHYLDRYDYNQIERMLDELYKNDEIDYDEESKQWLSI